MPHKKNRKNKFIKPIVIIGLLFLITTVFWKCVFPSPIRYANKFIRNISNQRLNLAYEMTSLEFQDVVDFRIFTELTDQLAVDSVQKSNIELVEIYKSLDPVQADFQVTFEYSEFDPETFDLKLIKDGRKWMINTMNVDSDIYEQL